MLDLGTLAAIIVAVAAVGGLIIQWVKRDKPWRQGQTDLTIRVSTTEAKVDNIDDTLGSIKKMLEEHESRDQKDFERIETKIEKLTDLMIKMLSDGKD